MGATGSKYNKISSSIQSPLLYLLRFLNSFTLAAVIYKW